MSHAGTRPSHHPVVATIDTTEPSIRTLVPSHPRAFSVDPTSRHPSTSAASDTRYSSLSLEPAASTHTSVHTLLMSPTPLEAFTTAMQGSVRMSERPTYLDVSALSPREYPVFTQWVERIKPAYSRREGRLDEHAAVKFLRSELGISVDEEVSIMSLFERLPLGLLPGHFYAMLRLAAWAQRGHAVARELLFIQTDPPDIRRRRHASTRITSTVSMPESLQGSPAILSAMDQASEPLGMDLPKAPPRSVPDRRPSRYGLLDHVQEPELGYHKVVFSPSEPRLVRPRPVVASTPAHAAPLSRPRSPSLPPAPVPPTQPVPPAPNDEAELAMPASSSKPMGILPDSPIAVPALRPPAPMPLQQVSPLIQASLNARSEFKKASRQWRPKTFTVLSSSSGQFEPDKPHLLNGQEVSPQALSVHTKRRTTSATKLSSQLASQNPDTSAVGDANRTQTIAPKPSYLGRERGVLPAWLREQYEEGNVLYPPPDPADRSVVSVFDALHNKAQQSMNGSERAAASINRNTPFFPPHERDRERAERVTANGSGPEQYRKLNEETSVGKRSSTETLGERPKLGTSRSKAYLKSRRPESGMASHTWGTQFEAGTYAGFKTTSVMRDHLMQLPHVSSKRSFHYRPIRELQPMLAMPHDITDAEDRAHNDPFPSQASDVPRLSRTQSLTLRPSEVQRARVKAENRISASPQFPSQFSRRTEENAPSRKNSRRMSKSKSVDMSKWISTSANRAATPEPQPESEPQPEPEPAAMAQTGTNESQAEATQVAEAETGARTADEDEEPPSSDKTGRKPTSASGDNSDAGTVWDHERSRELPPLSSAASEAPGEPSAEETTNKEPTSAPQDEGEAEAAT